MGDAEMRNLFSARLTALLEENHMTQIELGEMLNVSKSTVNKWIMKKAVPRMGLIEKLSSIFNVPKSYFLEENETKRAYYLDPDTAALAQELHDNPQYRALLDSSKKLTPDALREVMNFIDFQTKKESGSDD